MNKAMGAVSHFSESYYQALEVLTDEELRRLWIAEGKRRGYEVN